MSEEAFDKAMDSYQLDTEYAAFIMYKTDELVCNGDMLIKVMESGKYWEAFKESMVKE